MRREVLELLSGGTISGAAIDLPPIVPTFSGSGAASNNSRRGSSTSISTVAATATTAAAGGGAQRQQRLITSSSTTSNPTRASASTRTIGESGVQNKRSTKWIWAPFASSARNDGAMFYHWVKSHVEYPGKATNRYSIIL